MPPLYNGIQGRSSIFANSVISSEPTLPVAMCKNVISPCVQQASLLPKLLQVLKLMGALPVDKVYSLWEEMPRRVGKSTAHRVISTPKHQVHNTLMTAAANALPEHNPLV